VLQALELMERSDFKIALVVDEERRLLGTVTDGDIRRAILRSVSLQEPVSAVMNPHPTTMQAGSDRDEIVAIMREKWIRYIPLVDGEGRVLGMESGDFAGSSRLRDNLVMIMAGGQGTRLRPLTEDCPKPMLPVGGRPILETILLGFIQHGFRNFYFSVNYKAEQIREHFGDGSRWGVSIGFVEEQEPLGTAGALSLLPEKPRETFIVMNGDLLTKINFDELLNFHRSQQSQATMCVREYNFQVPFGVVNLDEHFVRDIFEKPVQRLFVNAGIYVLEPQAIEHVPARRSFDMPALFQSIIGSGERVTAFPVREYCVDVGQHADFERANGEFSRVF